MGTKIKEIEVRVGRTFNTGNYESLRVDVVERYVMTADDGEDDLLGIQHHLARKLDKKLKAIVKEDLKG